MIFINKITVTESERIKDFPLVIEDLKDLNIITGSNGSGKTTLLGGIRDLARSGGWMHPKEFDTKVKLTLVNPDLRNFEIYSLFYKEIANTKHNSDDYGDNMLFMIRDVMDLGHLSSGERSKEQINDMNDCENGLILIDEMDASLDWNQQKKYFEKLKKLSEKNQVIVATHSLIVCALSDRIYDMNKRKWTDWKELKSRRFKGVMI